MEEFAVLCDVEPSWIRQLFSGKSSGIGKKVSATLTELGYDVAKVSEMYAEWRNVMREEERQRIKAPLANRG